MLGVLKRIWGKVMRKKPVPIPSNGAYRTAARVLPQKLTQKIAREVTHLSIDFSPEAWKRLKEIMELAGDKKPGQTVRNALRFLEWALDRKSEGWELLLIDADGKAKRVDF